MKISKLLIPIMCALAVSATAQAKEYLNNGRMYDINDFENYNTGIISYRGADKDRYVEESSNIKCDDFGKITNSWALESSQGEMASAVDEVVGKDGNVTKALHFYVDGVSKSEDYHLIFQPTNNIDGVSAWNDKTDGKFYVYKFDFKSGGDGAGYFVGSDSNLDEKYTVDWSTGNVSVKKMRGITLLEGENGTQAFALDEWVTFTMIIDRSELKDIHYLRFESSLGTKEYKIQTNYNKNNYKIENSNPRFLIGNGWIRGGSDKPENPSLYIDNVQMYVSDYNVSLRNAGFAGVEPSQKIVLDIDGDIDEASLENIKVMQGAEPVAVKSTEYSDGVCTLTLDEKMKEFSEYTVDYSGVKSEDGISKNYSPQSFTTSGKIALSAEASLGRVLFNSSKSTDKLEKGLIRAEFTVKNTSAIDVENGIIIAKLMNGSSVEAVSYKKLKLAQGGEAKLVCAFTVPDENCKIELCAKSQIGGNVYFTDIFTADKNGISYKAAEDGENVTSAIGAANTSADKASFYKLSLGENSTRSAESALSAGLFECAANVSSTGEAMLITALKKDGILKSLVYTMRENDGDDIYTAVNVPDGSGYTLDAFVWNDLSGAAGYIGKTSISSVSEEK